jgi:hypothetical protein
MSLERGKFGIEWDPRQDERKSSGLGWVFCLVGLVALASLSVTIVRRVRSSADDEAQGTSAVAEAVGSNVEAASRRFEQTTPPPPPAVIPEAVKDAVTEKRPARVRNLLLRLEEAERRRDVDMAVSTIEQIRALPGSPAADLDDALARRLGVLNVRRLFERKTPLWVREVEVRRGDSASRIAAENGSTFASLVRLNGGNVETIRVGQKLYVMDHPRFTLVVHRRARTADLMLKDKFFKRYDLAQEPTGKAGTYELTKGSAAFWKSLGVSFKMPGQTEIDLLMPVGSNVLISEM